MKTTAKFLVLSLAMMAAGLSAHAQDAQPPAAQQGEIQTSDFRTFEPTGQEWETFRSSGQISHQGGEAVYNSVCAGCHMPEGQGAVGAGMYPALANNEMLAGSAYPVHLIIDGLRAMPPLGGILDDQQVADVVNYIRSNFGNDYIEEHGEAKAEDVAEARR